MLKSKKLWCFVISVFFMWISLKNVDWKQTPEVVSNLQFHYLFAAFVSLTCDHLLRSYRWKLIMANTKNRFFDVYSALIICNFFNHIFPARAGDVIRAFYLNKKNKASVSEILGSVLLERFLDGVIVLSMLALSIQFVKENSYVRHAAYLTAILYFCIMLFIVFAQFKKSLFKKITNKLFSFFPENISGKLQSSSDCFIDGFALVSKGKAFLKVLFLSFVCWGVSSFTYLVFIKMFNLELGFYDAMFFVSILAIGSMIPSSPGMIGIYQFCTMLTFVSILKQPAETAAVFGIVTHLLQYLYVIGVGMFVIIKEGISYQSLSQVSR